MKITRKLAAIACTCALAAQGLAVSAAADDASGWYYYYNGVYYSTLDDAWGAVGYVDGSKVTSVPTNNVPKGTSTWYSKTFNSYYNTQTDALAAGAVDAHIAYKGTYSSTTASTSGWWYSEVTHSYYSNYSDALRNSNNNSAYVKSVPYYGYYNGYLNGYYGYTYYVSSVTGQRYSTWSAALAASNYDSSKVTTHTSAYDPNYNYAAGSIYRYRYNGVYYGTLEDAIKAGGTALGVDIYYTPYGSAGDVDYYYYYNGTYYGSLQAAQNAGGTALGTDITCVPYGYYGVNYGYGYDYGYNYLYPYGYNYGYVFSDPYYTFKNQLANKNSTSATSTKEAEDGEPYIYGKKTRAGWDTIIKYIKAASAGSTIKVDMNGSYEVDKDVLEAIDGRNVSVTFVLDNGVKWTVNGKNVSTPKDMIIYTEYNIQYIPDSLVKKASTDAVGKAQIGVSSNFEDFGSKANVTVKFNSDRSGCTAVVYRYDPDANSLKGVSKAKVQSDGSTTFTVTAGGPYLIVLK
ncbi:MAG: hypothetical protein NC078_00975 [Ruminococcus sp.]|nr:hypothetical protein [Ruminococcus sp.]